MASKTIVLITGANSGIAFHTTEEFVKDKSFHVIMGCRSKERGEAALEKIKAQGRPGSVSLIQLDISSQSSIEAAAKSVEKEFGHLDVLINSAGIIVMDAKDQLDMLQRTFHTNVYSQLFMTEAFKPLLKASKAAQPRLIFVTSDLGSCTLRRQHDYYAYHVHDTEYRMSKSALNMLVVSYEEQFESTEGFENIKVYAFNPGYVITNLTGEAGIEMRKKTGAGDATESARQLVRTAKGERNGDQEKGMVSANSSATWFPW